MRKIILLLIIFLILLFLSIPYYKSNVEKIFNDKVGYRDCYLASDCLVDINEKFILYRNTEYKAIRCPWLSPYLDSEFPYVDLNPGVFERAGVFDIGGCNEPLYSNLDENSFDIENLVTKNGCNNKIYYLLTPKKAGEYKIDFKNNCQSGTINIIVS